MKTTIDAQAHVFTLINTFEVLAGRAQAVVESLRKFTEEETRGLAGRAHLRELKALVAGVNPVFYDLVYVGSASSDS